MLLNEENDFCRINNSKIQNISKEEKGKEQEKVIKDEELKLKET